jgi:GDP-L-fucose synthase
MNLNDNVLVLGGRGLVGSEIVAQLKQAGFKSVLAPNRTELNLFDQAGVLKYFETHKPAHVFMAAAKVGGIHANNTYRADFIFENLLIEVNVFNAAKTFVPKKFIFLGSSCIYPKNCPQPIKEEYLLTGALEHTNEPYAIAKIAGLKMAETFREQYGFPFYSIMPTNLYGLNDNFDLMNSHVIPGLIARMTAAKKNGDKVFKIWGTGNPRREFLHVSDLARACLFVMNFQGDLPNLLNVGTGSDIAIKDLAALIKQEVGLEATLEFDTSMPDGTMQKLLNVDRIKGLGWKPEITLEAGIREVVKTYQSQIQ